MHDARAAELEARLGALRAGFWLGWLSIAAVVAALALGIHTRHPVALIALTAAASAANAAVTLVPWRGLLAAARGRLLLDLWSAGLITFSCTLVVLAGARADFDLLLFLVAPFLATVHRAWRRVLWLAVAAVSYPVVMALAPAPIGTAEVAMRLALLLAATVLALALAAVVGREASTPSSPSLTTGSRTACRRSPTSSCWAGPTESVRRSSTRPQLVSARSPPSTACWPSAAARR
jgi:hypothetical protein